jgi:competence protein ComEA
MDTKKFIILLSCLTAVVCVLTVVYNFASMPPYGSFSESAVPLSVSQTQPLSYAQSSINASASSVDTASSATSKNNSAGYGTSASGTASTASVSSSSAKSKTSKTSRTSTSSSKATPQTPVNINTAALAQLETIPYVGQVKAQAILDYRTAHGSFKSINDLDNVKGIGAKTIAKIAAYITVG